METIGRGGFGFVRACKAKKGDKEAFVTKVSVGVIINTNNTNTNTLVFLGITRPSKEAR